ncbi:universal stress protein [Sphingobacteriaceae bacterium WQ 2009]|uniref:Universal stress protein n=1 Tax=Rhinopithecimicrobium faecis TaxID=2820698 RepID=A0A8T4HAC4_9SPHI|nr:universal stress protein [Sphingobacteriaceae bacterium WQ 2009]
MSAHNLNFQRILVALDDTPCAGKALIYARSLVEMYGASVALITVTQPTSPASYGADPLLGQQPLIVPEVSEIQQEAAQRYLQKVADDFNLAKEVFIFNRVGRVKDEILAVAMEWTADLIVIGSNGKTGFEHFISGSVSESVIRKAPCPVFVVPVNCD